MVDKDDPIKQYGLPTNENGLREWMFARNTTGVEAWCTSPLGILRRRHAQMPSDKVNEVTRYGL